MVVVSGARQVGKSTLQQHTLPDWDSVVFDPAIDVGYARQDPDLFLDNHPPPAVRDDIQFAPELVAGVKRRVDRKRRLGQYALTGSRQWSVLESASESLAGRAVFLDLEGSSLAEIAERTTVEHWLKRYLDDPDGFVARLPAGIERIRLPRTVYEQLWWGCLPEADALEPGWISELYRACLRTYIERDVRMRSDVGDGQQFGWFARLTAALTAQEVNDSQLGREIGVTPQTAQRWLTMLRATFQATCAARATCRLSHVSAWQRPRRKSGCGGRYDVRFNHSHDPDGAASFPGSWGLVGGLPSSARARS